MLITTIRLLPELAIIFLHLMFSVTEPRVIFVNLKNHKFGQTKQIQRLKLYRGSVKDFGVQAAQVLSKNEWFLKAKTSNCLLKRLQDPPASHTYMEQKLNFGHVFRWAEGGHMLSVNLEACMYIKREHQTKAMRSGLLLRGRWCHA